MRKSSYRLGGILTLRALSGIASSLFLPFMLVYLTQKRGLVIAQATLALGILALLPGFFGPIAGFCQDRVRTRTMLIGACAAWSAAASILISGIGGAAGIYFAVALLAAAGSACNVSFNVAVPRLLAEEDLPFGFSMMHSTANIGLLLGPAFAGLLLLKGADMTWLLLAAMVMQMVTVAGVAWVFFDEGPPPAAMKKESPSTARSPALLGAGLLFLSVLFLDWASLEQANSFLAKFLSDRFAAPENAAFFFSMQAIPVILLVPLAGRLTAKQSLPRLLTTFLFGSLALPIGFVAYYVIGRSSAVSGLIVFGTFMLIDELATIPAGGALAARLVPNKRYGAIFGLRSSVQAIGRAFGVSVGGVLYARAQMGTELDVYWRDVGALLTVLWCLIAVFYFRSVRGDVQP